MRSSLAMYAENDGDAYRTKDAKKAVDDAYRTYVSEQIASMRHEYSEIKAALIADLQQRWDNT